MTGPEEMGEERDTVARYLITTQDAAENTEKRGR